MAAPLRRRRRRYPPPRGYANPALDASRALVAANPTAADVGRVMAYAAGAVVVGAALLVAWVASWDRSRGTLFT